MQSNLLTYTRGYVQAEVTGRELEKLINTAYERGLQFWGVKRTSPHSVMLYIALSSFFELRPLLRETRSKIRIRRKFGLPFLLRRLESRIFFAAGFVCFLLAIYVLSQVVWKVDIEGNERIAYDEVIAAAEQAGIRPYQWKFKLREPQELSRELTSALEGAAWVGVEVKGTRVLIKIVEQTLPERKKLMNPRHLVSKYDAVVTDMFVERGKPAVRIHARVKKGDVLVSGQIGNESHSSIVVAEGSVKGLVWHEYDIASPLKHQHKVYTGNSKVRKYLVLGNRALQITGYGADRFAAYESDMHRQSLAWRNWKLPFGYIREERKEVNTEQQSVSAEEAKRIGLTHARGDLLQKAGENARITDEKILHEKIEGGKVYMKVLFEAEQEIAAELPIVQGD